MRLSVALCIGVALAGCATQEPAITDSDSTLANLILVRNNEPRCHMLAPAEARFNDLTIASARKDSDISEAAVSSLLAKITAADANRCKGFFENTGVIAIKETFAETHSGRS